LGTSIQYMTYYQAGKFVQSKKITGDSSFRNFKKNNTLPSNFPRAPESFYKKLGKWDSWGDFCGTGVVATSKRSYLSFSDARSFVHKLKIKSKNEWKQHSDSGKIPKNIPMAPDSFYKRKNQWTSWGDFLGTGTIAPQIISQNWLPWKDAKLLYRKIAKENNISTSKAWEKFVKTNILPKGLPPYPTDIYTEKRIRKTMK